MILGVWKSTYVRTWSNDERRGGSQWRKILVIMHWLLCVSV